MTYELKKYNDQIEIIIDNVSIGFIVGFDLLSQNELKNNFTSGHVFADDSSVKFKFIHNKFDVVSFNFQYVSKKYDDVFSVLAGDNKYTLRAKNATVVAGKNLVVGNSNLTEITIEPELTNEKFFSELMFVPVAPQVQSCSFFRTPPSFSITFYSDAAFQNPLKSFKDRQIFSGISTVYVGVIINQPTLNSSSLTNYFLNISDNFNYITKYPLVFSATLTNANKSLGFTTSFSFSKNNFINRTDGKINCFVSADKFVFSNTVKNSSYITASGAAYNPITTMSGIQSSHFNSGNITLGISSLPVSQYLSLGYSTANAFPFYYPSSDLCSGLYFPSFNLNPSTVTTILYTGVSSSLNGKTGGFLQYNFGTTGISSFISQAYSWAGVTFISDDDLSTAVNLSDYDIKFLYRYSNVLEPTIVSPLPQNVGLTVKTYTNPYNFIYASIPFNQYIDNTKILTSFEARILKTPKYYPVSFKAYEFKIFNYTSITVSNFNAFSVMNFSTESVEPVIEDLSSNNSGLSEGDTICGFDGQIIGTQVNAIYEGIAENLYDIKTDIIDLIIPESYQVYKMGVGFVNLWDLSPDDQIMTLEGYTTISEIKFIEYKPHYVIETDCGNYFADQILVKPSITVYHKKTRMPV